MPETPIIRNVINGEVKKVELDVFLATFTDDFSRRNLERLLLRQGVAGAVLFENLQMDSRHFGQKSAMSFGPGCTYKTVEDAATGRLGTLPSTFQYPVMYVTSTP